VRAWSRCPPALAGQLAQVLDASVDPGTAYHFVGPKGEPVGAKLAACRRLLMDEVRRAPFA